MDRIFPLRKHTYVYGKPFLIKPADNFYLRIQYFFILLVRKDIFRVRIVKDKVCEMTQYCRNAQSGKSKNLQSFPHSR